MASVAEIDGLTVSGAAPVVPAAAAAYSVRLLDSLLGTTYTGVAMRIRRVTGTGNTGNDDEADVAFDSGVISLDSAVSNFSANGSNATTLGQFLNVGTVNGTAYTDADSLSPNTAAAYVDEWKDQSGNQNHAEQSTPSLQSQVHDGTVDTDLFSENGKPALDFPNPGAMTNLTLAASSGQKVSMFSVASISGGSLGFMIHTSELDNYRLPIARSGNSNAPADGVGSLSFFKDGSSVTVTDRDECYTEYVDSTQHMMTVFGTLSTDITAGNTNTFGGRSELDTAYPVNGPIQEITIYYGATDQSSNRTGIETNINTEYLIYQPTDAPTSGLLADYTGAAAAYSVRQLSDKAILCMRIRRDMGAGNPGDDDEINIGFDSNGDLDTQAIADFCGTGTGWVTRWWDQSVNGNHADQQTNGSEPQIYNGTAVITANGKPALQKTDRPTSLDLTTSLALSDFCVSWAGDRDSLRDEGIMLANTAITEYLWDRSTLSFSYAWDGGSTTTGATGVGPKLYVINKNGSSINNRMNGTAYAATLAGTLNLDFAITPGVNSWEGEINEIIIWNSNKASEQTDIETDIDDYFNII